MTIAEALLTAFHDFHRWCEEHPETHAMTESEMISAYWDDVDRRIEASGAHCAEQGTP